MTRFDRSEQPIRARHTVTSFETAPTRERFEAMPLSVRMVRRLITSVFGLWVRLSTALVSTIGWYARVDPYVGYGTEEYSRLVCRTVLAPAHRQRSELTRGIRAALAVPAPHTQVSVAIDGQQLRTVQVGDTERYDEVDGSRERGCEFTFSDTSGYLDLVARHRLRAGRHLVSYTVAGRAPVHTTLFTIPASARIGIISDVDDTIMVTQVPTLWKAVYNVLLLNPRKRMPVPGMSALYARLRVMLPDAPFFYLSTSPWNVEGSIRHFISHHGYPEGPLLLRDLDPRPKTFIPSGVQHKLEFVSQLMNDFPGMRFILIGDDGQGDPFTFSVIARHYPGRILAIGIRQVATATPLDMAMTVRRAPVPGVDVPDIDVPVFTGPTGANLMKTMLPYLEYRL